jgi:hypothetical protein
MERPRMTTIADRAAVTAAAPARIAHFAAADAAATTGAQLRAVREAARSFREWFASTGTPESVSTHDLVSLPYPTRFGLWRAARTPAPFLTITNRLIIVRWREGARERTLLFEPSDVELGRNTPYFAALTARTPKRLEGVIVNQRGTVLERLRTAGIDPAGVDYLMFDHLHTQDVRRWIGTEHPAPDISPKRPVDPVFPNARLVVQRAELDAIADLHPLQRPWYQPETYADLRGDAILAIDGDVLLGPGVAVLGTPGHTIGNQSLVLNTSTGIWASSENVIAAECLTPEHSRIPGVRAWALEWGQEVVLNANTLEATAQQYNSCVKEKSVVDRSVRDPRFLQFLPSSELTASALAPGTKPTFTHGGISHRTSAQQG